MVTKYLVRLYDLEEGPLGGMSVAVAPPGTGASIPLTPAVPSTIEEHGQLVLSEQGSPVGTAELHPLGACSLGPVVLADGQVDARRSAVLMRFALLHLRWAGYAYCLLTDLPHDEGVRAATVPVPTASTDAESRLADRDDRSLPWGDIFVDLSNPALPYFPSVLSDEGKMYTVRRAEASEQMMLIRWISEEFGAGWASEMTRSFANTPISSVVAVETDDGDPSTRRPAGFISYNTTRSGMLSSIAVRSDLKGIISSIGGALLTQCLYETRARGFSYAVLGGVSRRVPALRSCPGSWTIPGSHPGIFGKGINAL